MKKNNLPQGWKYEVFDKIENPITLDSKIKAVS